MTGHARSFFSALRTPHAAIALFPLLQRPGQFSMESGHSIEPNDQFNYIMSDIHARSQ